MEAGDQEEAESRKGLQIYWFLEMRLCPRLLPWPGLF